MTIKKCIIAAAAMTCGIITPLNATTTENTEQKASAAPAWSEIFRLNGTFRGSYELLTGPGLSRFQVRNARLSLGGDITPWLGYFTQVDLCDRTEFKFLDAYATFKPSRAVEIIAGQSRVPFNSEAHLAPHQYIFANRSFVGKELGSTRRPGVKARLKPLRQAPLKIELGAASSGSHAKSGSWGKHYDFAARASYGSADGVTAEAGFQSIQPDRNRINCLDAAIQWRVGGLFAKGEYTRWHYTGSGHKAVNACMVEADYGVPLKCRYVNRISAQARFDAMGDYSTGVSNADGLLTTDKCERRRLTLGATAAYIVGGRHAALRLNYEQYFYDKDNVYAESDGSKLVVELIVRF